MMEFGVLGPLLISHQGEPVSIGGRQRRQLLALLIAHANEAVSGSHLASQLWGETPPPTARKTLQSHIAHLRRALNVDDQILRARPPGYVLKVESDQLDALLFQQIVRDAIPALPEDPTGARDALIHGLDLWRGQLAYEDVSEESLDVRAEAVRLEELRLAAFEHRFRADLLLGDHMNVIPDLEQAAAKYPLRENLWGMLMLALYRSNRQAESLDAFRRARLILAEELGIEPSAQLMTLEEQILLQDPALAWSPTSTMKTVVESRSESDRRLPGLPGTLSGFVGRRPELAELKALVSDVRLITITGAGGSGKTRLAIEMGRELADRFEERIWLVGFAELSDPTLVLPTAARALGIMDDGVRDPFDLVLRYVGNAESLLILDNCEHLLDPIAALVGALLENTTNLRIICTSREPIGLAGEVVWSIPLLDTPSQTTGATIAELDRFDATRLFLERVGTADPHLELTDHEAPAIAEICRRLDGLPLAIELAAGRVRAIGIAEIAARLDDVFEVLTGGSRGALPRQRTIEATISWSYDLLSTPEKEAFERMSVFRGGFELETALSVVGESSFSVLASLVEKSLLVSEPHDGSKRFRMLETVLAFGQRKAGERLDAHRDALLGWAARFALSAAANLEGPDQATWVARVETEIDNLRAAMSWSIESQNFEPGMVVVSSLFNYWYMRDVREGRSWAERFLATEPVISPVTLAWTMFTGGALAHQEGEHESETAAAILERSLDIFRRIGDQHGIGYALHHLARTHWGKIDPAGLRVEFKTALEAFQEVGDLVGMATSLSFLVWLELEYGGRQEAMATAEELYRLTVQIGSANIMAHGNELLGTSLWRSGYLARAASHLNEAIRLYRLVNNLQCEAHCLEGVAAWSLAVGDLRTAALLLAFTDALRTEIGVFAPRWERFVPTQVRQELEATLSRDSLDGLFEEGSKLTISAALDLATDVTVSAPRLTEPLTGMVP